MPTDKHYTRQVTERFLKEMDRIVGYDGNQKTNQYDFAVNVNLDASNLSRMKKNVRYNVSIEACILLCHHYGTDPAWLLMGEDYEVKVDERIMKLDKLINKLERSIKKTSELTSS